MRLTMRIDGGEAVDRNKLVFHRYGERYFLSEVWMAGEAFGGQLIKSKEESAIQRRLVTSRKKREVAQRGFETVEILAALR